MRMVDRGKQVREIAAKLLADGKVELIIGYEKGTLPLKATPCFAKNPEDVKKLIWDPSCDINLVKYMLGREEKIGVVAKGCDSRAISVCISEGQIDREKTVIIGLPCSGVVDVRKVQEKLDDEEMLEAVISDDRILVKGADFETELSLLDNLSDACLVCMYRNPPLYDVLVGETITELEEPPEYADVDDIEEKTEDERWNFFVEEIGDCIRCYACRNVCPLCYCKSCFVDDTMPTWFGKTNDASDTMNFHIVRALHLAGRCVDCGACERACPMGIKLRTLSKKVGKIVKERFDYEAGLDPEAPPLLGTYEQDDPEEFIR